MMKSANEKGMELLINQYAALINAIVKNIYIIFHSMDNFIAELFMN